MYRRILVPVDGSTASQARRGQAIGLAQAEGARLRFLNVVDESLGFGSPDIQSVNMSQLLTSMRELGEKSVADAASLARKKGLRTDTSVVPSRGRRASDVILDEAQEWGAAPIVRGTHGHRGFNRLLLGSDAERVLRDTPVPLLLVREGHNKARRKRTAGKEKMKDDDPIRHRFTGRARGIGLCWSAAPCESSLRETFERTMCARRTHT